MNYFERLFTPFMVQPSSSAGLPERGPLDTLTKMVAGNPPEADPEMQAVLDKLAALHGKPIEELTPEDARRQPTPTDAVKLLLESQGKSTAPLPVGSVRSIEIAGPYGQLPLHIYTPQGVGPFPVIVYFHGGGFVIADTQVYEASVRGLCVGAPAVVVSVDYHHAPEYRFPVQTQEAYAAYRWVRTHATEIDGDAHRIAVAGESAGGNLAAVVSLMARDRGESLPVHALLVYPLVSDGMTNLSYVRNANAKPLNRDMMKWFFSHYISSKDDAGNPYTLPDKAETLRGFPPTTLITAEIDPLYSEGKDFAERLEDDGVPVAYKHYEGVTHEFFGMAAVLQKARDAQQFACAQLKQAFAQPMH